MNANERTFEKLLPIANVSCIVKRANVAIEPDTSHSNTSSGFEMRGGLNCGSMSAPPWARERRIVRRTSRRPLLPRLRRCASRVASLRASG